MSAQPDDSTDSYIEAVQKRLGKANPFNRRTVSDSEATSDEAAEMRKNRRVTSKMQRTGSMGPVGGVGGGGGSDIAFATGRPRDPMWYWKQNNLPWDVNNEDHLKKIRAFCNTPDAPIWMGDYSFKPIGEVVAGDEVIGWEYRTGPKGQLRKKLVRTTVVATQRRIAPEVVRVTMESGKIIRCTPDHLWANPHYSPGQISGSNGWRQPEFKQAEVGGSLVSVIEPTPALESEKERLVAAWLAGVYDGEGCGNEIAQSLAHNPGVCQRITESLDFLGLPWTQQHDRIFIRMEGQGYRYGAQQDLVDFLNWTDPVRRVTAANDRALLTRPSGGKDKIISIESEGPGEVVSMQTGTGNYVAWGYASKNCRVLYMTHPIVGSCVDIYSKYPLLGLSLECKDEAITEFYETLFFDEENGLNYHEFLLDVGREYWVVGESWPFASFNETLGVWDDEELLNPDDIEVHRDPFQREPRYLIKLPQSLRDVITTMSPRWQFDRLMALYPELRAYASEDALMPVSNMLLRQLKFKGDTFNKRGIPLLMRAFRPLLQEEMLNAAMDSIADRLYTPLILVKLGASANDLGTTVPWIPTQDDLADFEEAFDAAMAADFRVLTHHFAVDMEPVFGRENMPNMNDDFDRLEDRILQTFGLSRTMLEGASGGETYAADALNRDLISQLLTTYQDLIKRLFRQRAIIVAEAQGHFDYDERNGKRYVKMEEILEVDEETGEERIVEQPKLLIPELKMKTMNMRDENVWRQFIEAGVATGMPISMKTRLRGADVDLDEEIEIRKQEAVQAIVAEQEVRKEAFLALRAAGLPIPPDLAADFQPKAMGAVDPMDPMGQLGQGTPPPSIIPALGMDPSGTPNLAPTPADMQQDQPDDPAADGQASTGMAQVIPMPQRPPESDEMRAGMPTQAQLHRNSSLMREAVAKHYQPPDNSRETSLEDHQPEGKFGAPRHTGLRRHARNWSALRDIPMDEWDQHTG